METIVEKPIRKMLLSFKPEIFELIRQGKKIYEYRTQFAEDKVIAYMYVSKPVQQIVGYIELDNRIVLTDWEEKYREDKEVLKRIHEYMDRNNKYVMPIKKFHMTTRIDLKDLQVSLTKFIIPQSYYYLDNFPELDKYISEYLEELDEVVVNEFSPEDTKNICVRSYR